MSQAGADECDTERESERSSEETGREGGPAARMSQSESKSVFREESAKGKSSDGAAGATTSQMTGKSWGEVGMETVLKLTRIFRNGEVTVVRRRETHLSDRIFYWILKAMAWGMIALLIAIVWMLVDLARPALTEFGWRFFTLNDWNPPLDIFGALPFIFGTVVSSTIALLIAAPISIGVALFLTELAPRGLARVVGFLVEMLAAIPSVVYGLWGIFVLSPLMANDVQPWFMEKLGPESPFRLALFGGPAYGYGLLTAGVVLAIMITPTIAAISREVFMSVPATIREAPLALGATRWEMIKMAVITTSRSGLLGAVILGLGRALGETMAVAMVIGNRNEIPDSILKPAQTMASVIANEYPEASGLHMSSLAAVGLALFAVSLVINTAARLIIWRFEGARR